MHITRLQCRDEVKVPGAVLLTLFNRMRTAMRFPATVWESRQQFSYYIKTYIHLMRVEKYEDLNVIQKHIYNQLIYHKKENDVRRLTAEGVRKLYQVHPSLPKVPGKQKSQNSSPDEDEETVDR